MALPGRLLAVVALVALIGAGCANAPAESGSGGDQNAVTEGSPNLLEFAECMRENGVEDFPDPNDDGIIQYYGDPDPAEFTSASERCDDPDDRPDQPAAPAVPNAPPTAAPGAPGVSGAPGAPGGPGAPGAPGGQPPNLRPS